MKMRIIIGLKKDEVMIFLKDGRKAVDEVGFSGERELYEKLLPAIESLLSRHSLKAGEIEKFELETEIPDFYTSFRIAKATVETLNWGKRQKF